MAHGRLEIQNFSSRVEKIFLQHSKRNFISPRGQVISSVYCIALHCFAVHFIELYCMVLSPKHLWHCLQNKKIPIYSRNIWQSS